MLHNCANAKYTILASQVKKIKTSNVLNTTYILLKNLNKKIYFPKVEKAL